MENNFEEFEKAEDNLLDKISKEKSEIAYLQKKNEEKKLAVLKVSLFIQILIMLIAAILMARQYPEVSVSVRPQRILRMGTYETDAKTDECLSNIWKLMKDRNLKLKCPVCGLDYKIEEKNIYCPDPKSHGHEAIYSKNGDIPRIE